VVHSIVDDRVRKEQAPQRFNLARPFVNSGDSRVFSPFGIWLARRSLLGEDGFEIKFPEKFKKMLTRFWHNR
jgi:hypothetical protein